MWSQSSLQTLSLSPGQVGGSSTFTPKAPEPEDSQTFQTTLISSGEVLDSEDLCLGLLGLHRDASSVGFTLKYKRSTSGDPGSETKPLPRCLLYNAPALALKPIGLGMLLGTARKAPRCFYC